MKKNIILGLVCSLAILVLVTGCGPNTSSKDDSEEYNISIKKIDGVDVKTYISSGQDQLIVSAINKSGKTIGSGYVKVRYYDENDEEIIYSPFPKQYGAFENDGEIVYGFELPEANKVGHYIPARTEVEITMDEDFQETLSDRIEEYVEKFTYSYSKTDKSVTLILKNTSDREEVAPRHISVVFYKNNKPVYSKEVSFYYLSVGAGETKTEEFDIPINYKILKETAQEVLIDYDDIKIFKFLDYVY